MSLPSIRRVDTIETETYRGYVLDHVQVIFEDGRAPHVLIWYFDQRDGFEAEVDYEIWNEAFTRIVQEAQTIPGTGFDYNLIALFAEKDDGEIESDNPIYGTRREDGDDPARKEYARLNSHVPW